MGPILQSSSALGAAGVQLAGFVVSQNLLTQQGGLQA